MDEPGAPRPEEVLEPGRESASAVGEDLGREIACARSQMEDSTGRVRDALVDDLNGVDLPEPFYLPCKALDARDHHRVSLPDRHTAADGYPLKCRSQA